MGVNLGHSRWIFESDHSAEKLGEAGQLIQHGSGSPCVQRLGCRFERFVIMAHPKELLLGEDRNQKGIHGS